MPLKQVFRLVLLATKTLLALEMPLLLLRTDNGLSWRNKDAREEVEDPEDVDTG